MLPAGITGCFHPFGVRLGTGKGAGGNAGGAGRTTVRPYTTPPLPADVTGDVSPLHPCELLQAVDHPGQDAECRFDRVRCGHIDPGALQDL